MNLLSRIAGAARLLATGKLALSASFDGAQMQRRLVAWRASGESINSLLRHGGEVQRARARQLVRSNPYAANASASFTAHAVGCGIKPSSLVEDPALKDRIQRLWLAWTDEADADGLTDFYGLQAMATRAMFEANATPLGMNESDPLPIDVSRLDAGAFVGEVVMKEEITPLLRAAQERGCAIQVGTDMLFEQIPAYLEFFGFPTTTSDELRAVAKIRS